MPRRLPLLLLLLVVAVAAPGCGGSSGEADTATAASMATVTDGATDAERLGADRAKDAVGAVSVCGAIGTTRALLPGLRRFDAADERLQVSTLGFPGGERTIRAFQERQRLDSEDCDVFVARDATEVRALAAEGSLFDLARPLATWVAGAGGAPLRPVLVGDRAFGLPFRSAGVAGVLVVSVHGRNPGGALEVVRALAGARPRDGR
jgi:hypothetical protein